MRDTENFDILLLNKLFEKHPRKNEKILGRKAFNWKKNHLNGISICFENGEEETVSIKKLVQAYFKSTEEIKENAKKEDIIRAFRCVISPQIYSFRMKQDLMYRDGKLFHVGHDYERGERFIELVEQFLFSENMFLLDVHVTRHSCCEHLITDKNLACKWFQYHKDNAILRMESADDNLKGNKGFKKRCT